MPGHAVPARTMISVSSAPPKPGQGELLLLTIYSGPANVDEWVFGHFYPHARVVPARSQLPTNTSYERFRRLEESMMANSQATAKVVALRQLGYSVPERGQGAVVENVRSGRPPPRRPHPGVEWPAAGYCRAVGGSGGRQTSRRQRAAAAQTQRQRSRARVGGDAA